MRKLLISLAISALAFSAVQSQSLEQILKEHYKASGQEKISKIKTVITKGKLTYVTAGMESAITLYQLRPDKVRMEASILGSKVIQTYNGTTGWMYAPAMGIAQPQEMGEAELRAVLQQVEFDSPLWNYQEKGSTAELAGSSDDGAAHLVKLTQEDGQVITLIIDKKSHLISGTSTLTVMGGAETEVNVTMKDYKAVKGIQTAHYVSTKINGEVMFTLAIESIEYNKDIDPGMFEKPSTE